MTWSDLMAAKPKPARIADVFARPGAAPARGRAIEDLPRPAMAVPEAVRDGSGLKSSTVGTTLYLLPEESRRLRHLAVDLGSSLHDLMLTGLDKVLQEHGQLPLRRYEPAKPRKEKKR